MINSPDKRWYALRVFKNRLPLVKRQVEDAGNETYQAVKTAPALSGDKIKSKTVPLIPALLFVRVTETYVTQLKRERYDQLMVYGDVQGRPEPIDDAQMDVFILITSPGGGCEVDYLPDGEELYKKGDPVKVTGGFYRGATGVVKRIKKDRKLLVAIEGVAVVAVSNIPIEFIQKLPSAAEVKK